MADVKQILVVDDHFEMLEFLRSMLELSNRDYQVLGVPSAEEGFLELRRTPFDLLITDLRLPGMSGFDLIRKVQRFRAEIPIIMITGYSSEQGQKEATDLGIFRYFQKPLDTDGLLAAVRAALYGPELPPEPPTPTPAAIELSADVRKRLDMLRTDTGAKQIVLASVQGHLLYESGYASGLDLASLVSTMAGSVHNSFHLADQLGSDEPFMIHYQSGRLFDVYSANVGRDCFVAMFFDTESRRGRIGTIWVFAQRAIKDLTALLPAAPAVKPLASADTIRSARRVVPPTEKERVSTPPAPIPARSVPAKTVSATAASATPPKPAETRPVASKPTTPPPPAAPINDLPPAAPPPAPVVKADIEGLMKELGLSADKAMAVDVDAFWDTALLSDSGTAGADLHSLDAAQAQGFVELELLPPASGTPPVTGTPATTPPVTDTPTIPEPAVVDVQGLIMELGLSADKVAEVDVDAFWDTALSDEETAAGGFTFDEAMRQGLLSSDFSQS